MNAQVETKSLRAAGLENFEVMEVHRSQIKSAPYNPRHISDNEKAQLKAAIKIHGLVEPLVWNKRTGTLVGGHQRISITDQLMDTGDYTLSVAMIDVDAAKEKELNVLLNNVHAMGSFDMDKLAQIFKDDPTVSVAGAGFSQSDIMQLFGSPVFENRSADLEEFSATLTKIAAQYDAISAKNSAKGASEHFLVFVFPSGDHVAKFVADHGFEDSRYQNGNVLIEKLNGIPRPA